MKYLLIFPLLILIGCETVEVSEYMMHKDLTPIVGAKINVYNKEFNGTTTTDEHGFWSMQVPPDVVVDLCVAYEEGKACHVMDSLITPSIDSGEVHMHEAY